MSEFTTISVRPPAASNFAGYEGLAVKLGAVATGEARCALLTASDDGTLSNAALGIIIAADNQNGGTVTVCTGGPCKALAGAAITPGTDVFLMVNAGGGTDPLKARLIPVTDGNFYVARFVGKQVAADGDLIDIIVQPGNLENT